MIEVPVRYQDHIHTVNRVILGIRRIALDPRIDQNDFPGGQAELIGSVTEPSNFNHSFDSTRSMAFFRGSLAVRLLPAAGVRCLRRPHPSHAGPSRRSLEHRFLAYWRGRSGSPMEEHADSWLKDRFRESDAEWGEAGNAAAAGR